MAGIFLASPRETITVAVEAVPESVPVAKPETISLWCLRGCPRSHSSHSVGLKAGTRLRSPN